MSILMLASAMSARAAGSRNRVETALARFDHACHPQVARLARADKRLGDLAISFPGLLHRLAVRPRAPGAGAAAALVLDGGSLKEAAALAGAPYWLRKLPPEAFGVDALDLPDGEWFRHRITNCLPRRRRHAAEWLEVVALAGEWGDEDAVLWMAREHARQCAAVRVEAAPLLALFAWFSKRPDLVGGSLGGERWSHALSGKQALERAQSWLRSATFAIELGDRRFDPWLEADDVDGYEFRPLATRADLIEEAIAMDNCLRTYGTEITHDFERMFGVRREGERVATLSVAYRDNAPFPHLDQLKGPRNAPVAAEVWFAARRWLEAQSTKRPVEIEWGEAALDRRAWVEMWRPYWLARRRIPQGLPLAPNRSALEALRGRRRRRLARRWRRA